MCLPRVRQSKPSPGKQARITYGRRLPSIPLTHAPQPQHGQLGWEEATKGPSFLPPYGTFFGPGSARPMAKTQADPGPLVDTGLWQTQAPTEVTELQADMTTLEVIRPSVRQTLTQWVKPLAHRPRLVVGLVRPEEFLASLLSTYAGLMTTGGLLTWGKAESSDPQQRGKLLGQTLLPKGCFLCPYIEEGWERG